MIMSSTKLYIIYNIRWPLQHIIYYVGSNIEVWTFSLLLKKSPFQESSAFRAWLDATPFLTSPPPVPRLSEPYCPHLPLFLYPQPIQRFNNTANPHFHSHLHFYPHPRLSLFLIFLTIFLSRIPTLTLTQTRIWARTLFWFPPPNPPPPPTPPTQSFFFWILTK